MPKKQVIEFTETNSPITEPVTKFGGQPVWIGELAWPLSKDRLQQQACEFAVKLIQSDDIEFVSEDDRFKMSEEDAALVTGTLDENKVAGSPVFMQGDEFPFEGQCQLLLQLDSLPNDLYQSDKLNSSYHR